MSSTDEDTYFKSNGNGEKLRVLFSWAKPMQRSIDLMKPGVCDVDEEENEFDYDYDTENIYKKRQYKVSKFEYGPDSIPTVKEITEEMLENIVEKTSLK